MKGLDQWARKLQRYAIPHLMYGLSAIMMAVFLADIFFPAAGVSGYLALDMSLVAQGQVWRLLTFLFLPPSSSPFWILFNLYFYCLMGNSLENQWGDFRFNLFYFSGALGTIIAALLTGFGTNFYLNLSLFLAFAMIYPDFEVMVFFLLPVKVKYLALIDLAFFIFALITGTWIERAAILFSLLNVLLFFGGGFFKHIREQAGYWKTRRNFRKTFRR